MIAIRPWYAKVPKTPEANRRWRLDVLKECEESSQAREWIKACCKDDIFFYLNGFAWTFNPRLKSGEKTLPFITFAIQDRLIEVECNSIENQRDLVIEKARDQGATWITLVVFEHHWHFGLDNTFLCISRDEDMVDKYGEPDCLFYKLDVLHRYTPKWLMPKGYNPQVHRRKFVFENPEQGCTINGEATVEGAGVGGRRTAILFDEFSLIEQDHEMLLGTADVSDCRIFNFTARGKGNAAYELATDPLKQKFRMDWTTDPRKAAKLYQWDGATQRVKYFIFNEQTLKVEECKPHQYGPEDADRTNFEPPGRPFEFVRDGRMRSPKFDAEALRRGLPHMAMNWEINYTDSGGAFFDLALLQELNREFCMTPSWEGDIVIDALSGDILEFEEEKGGPLRLWFRPELARCPRSSVGFGAGADLSWGQGATNSCCSFLDGQSNEKVGEYVRPDEVPEKFADKVVALGRWFQSESGAEALLAWERIGPGTPFAKRVFERDYQNVYTHGAEGRKKGKLEMQNRLRAGWPPNDENRYELFGEYQAALRARKYINRSSLALAECECYVHTDKGMKYVAKGRSNRSVLTGEEDASGARENHGDRPTADALALRAVKSIMGRRWMPSKAEVPAPEDLPGTFAWRMRIHEDRKREREESWS